jgi:hypothetical protein
MAAGLRPLACPSYNDHEDSSWIVMFTPPDGPSSFPNGDSGGTRRVYRK